MSERLLDRLEDMNKKFPVAAVLGGAAESVVNRLQNSRAGIREVHYFDASEAMLRRVRKVGRPFPSVVSMSGSGPTQSSKTAVVLAVVKLGFRS